MCNYSKKNMLAKQMCNYFKYVKAVKNNLQLGVLATNDYICVYQLLASWEQRRYIYLLTGFYGNFSLKMSDI
jgi:hypothetical protein